jgi:hypothetical protein
MTLTRLHLKYFCLFAILASLFPSLTHAGTWLPFGPKTYTRGTGAPVTVTDTFTLLNPATQYTLKAFNGGLQNTSTELVSSSVVMLNGVQVLGPSNFNQNVTEVDVPIFPQLSNTLSVQVRGQPGGVLAIEIVGVDNDPPSISGAISSTPPNAAGWNNSPVTVTFTCSDKTSGVASCPSPVTVSTQGANQVVSGTATDLAGNTASTSVTINLDMTPPTITASINPLPDAGGYNSGPVSVTFTCTDDLSGVASCPAPVSVTTEGTTSVTGTVVDVAGNVANATTFVNISFSYFKIRSWQTNPPGDRSQTGKCLDYGISPTGDAGVFLNDCSAANPVRVWELPEQTYPDGQTCQYEDGHGNCFHHEVLLYAGNVVIGICRPQTITSGCTSAQTSSGGSGGIQASTSGSTTTSTTPPPTEYQLELQPPFTSKICATGPFCYPTNQIFRLDGDSIMLEGTPASNGLPALRTPCLDTVMFICQPPPPQLVIQVQNARGANGSPLVAAVRNLADNEFWDFVPQPGSRPYPTTGFNSALGGMPITTSWQLWNAICASPQATAAGPTVFSDPTQPNYGQPVPCGASNVAWGSVIVVSDGAQQCAAPNAGPCIDLSGYPPIFLPAGVTIRGNRRGTNFGPQLYAAYGASGSGLAGDCDSTCIFDVHGDYVRVTGLRVRGQSRSTDGIPFKTDGIWVSFPGRYSSPPTPLFNLGTVTEYIATVDHNDMSDWMDGAVATASPFSNLPSSNYPTRCTYLGFTSNRGSDYACDRYANLEGVPYPYFSLSPVAYADDPATLSNVHVARNFLHHNERDNGGYGVTLEGRALIEGNTFSWNRHDITAAGEPHNEYRASHNLVLSGAYAGYGFLGANGRLQDFDMHGTDDPTVYVGGAGGYYVEIDGNTFLGTSGLDYRLRGYPIVNSYYHGNASLRTQGAGGLSTDAVQFTPCNLCITSDFPINVSSDNEFANSSPSYTDPTARLGVGDFDGDGDDDLFMATGNTWFYSPGGQREWRYLNSAPDTIGQLLFGDFDGDGRTDVVGMRNGQLFVSWGGISAFDLLNSTVPANCTMANMTVGDFNGVGRKTDIFCAAWQQSLNTYIWWISYGGNTTFTQVNSSAIPPNAFRFGHFAVCGTGAETDVFSVQSTGWYVSCGATTLWQPLGVALTQTVDGLVVADFNGDGIADVGMPCSSGLAPGWQIWYGGGGAQGWSTCNTFASPLNAVNCLLSISPCITLANGAVGRFNGGPGADILLWNYYNSQGAATLWDFPGGTGTPYQLSAQDVDMH